MICGTRFTSFHPKQDRETTSANSDGEKGSVDLWICNAQGIFVLPFLNQKYHIFLTEFGEIK
ncbi:unnamed protein product, partial [Ilex paraguariensis]